MTNSMTMFFAIFPLCYFFLSGPKEPFFQPQLIDDRVDAGYSIAIGDVDGDGKPDVLLADGRVFAWYRNGDWKKFILAENLGEQDQTCIAARDIDGDGKAEVAVGAGTVYYLERPENPTARWSPIRLHGGSGAHSIRWAEALPGRFHLVVLSLPSESNKANRGPDMKVTAYERPDDPRQEWPQWTVGQSARATHSLGIGRDGQGESVYVSNEAGVQIFHYKKGKWRPGRSRQGQDKGKSLGEVNMGSAGDATPIMAAIEPVHGNEVTVYVPRKEGASLSQADRVVLDEDLHEACALAVADFIGQGRDQVVAGWRKPDKNGRVGIKLYTPFNSLWEAWNISLVDGGDMSCEDLTVADLNNDGLPDIVAVGSDSHNLKIYWNRSE